MKSLRFWILIAGSVLVCSSYMVQILFSRAILQEQLILSERQQFASLAPTYENSWKELASRLYEMSRQDAALGEVLKRNQINVQVNRPAPLSAPAPAAVEPTPVAPPVEPPLATPKHSASKSGAAVPAKVPAKP